MNIAAQYWTLTRINPAGGHRTKEEPKAKTFLQTYVLTTIDPVNLSSDCEVQLRLLEFASASEFSTEAILCLRCFISHKILKACQILVDRYREQHQITENDLLPLVLTDDGTETHYPNSLAYKILATFKPKEFKETSLTNWTIRLAHDDKELNRALLQYGIYRLTNWAILNSFKLPHLQSALKDLHNLNEADVRQAEILLESYHEVYTFDRQNSGLKGRCLAPTEDQLQRISQVILNKTNQQLPIETVLFRLEKLASRLREHEIVSKGGKRSTKSIDTPETKVPDKFLSTSDSDEPERNDSEIFLQHYRQQFLNALDQSIQAALSERLPKFRSAALRDRYLKAMKLFYCERLSQTEIAKQFGLKDQATISHALDLKKLRATIRRIMLKILKSQIQALASRYQDAEKLQQLDEHLDDLLGEQIDRVIQEEERRAKTPKEFASNSILAERMCLYLEQIKT